MRHFSVIGTLVTLVAVVFVATVRADLVFIGPLTAGASGLGTVNTVLTIQQSSTESGCVGWNGTADVVGPAACPAGIVGGDEKTGASQTQTRTIAELGLPNAASIRLVFNANEPDQNSLTVSHLVLRIYHATTGAVLFSGPFRGPIFFPETNSGTGAAGFGFALDAPQAIAAQAAGFGNTANRLGISATATDTQGGTETLYLFNAAVLQPAPPGLPPVPTLPQLFVVLLAVGLGGIGYMRLKASRSQNDLQARS